MSFSRIVKKLGDFVVGREDDSSIDHAASIEAIEEKIGKRLPADYAEFLVKYGGCYLESRKTTDDVEYDVCYRPIEKDPWMGEEDETQLLECFYGLSRDNSVLSMIDTYSDRFPPEIIPIAASPGGNEICLDLDNGCVLFWDHELRNPDEDFYLIANSFEEFILRLEEERIEDDESASDDVEIEIIDNDFGKLLFGKDE